MYLWLQMLKYKKKLHGIVRIVIPKSQKLFFMPDHKHESRKHKTLRYRGKNNACLVGNWISLSQQIIKVKNHKSCILSGLIGIADKWVAIIQGLRKGNFVNWVPWALSVGQPKMKASHPSLRAGPLRAENKTYKWAKERGMPLLWCCYRLDTEVVFCDG